MTPALRQNLDFMFSIKEIGMATCTADLNADPERCDAFHEAGHAVVGVVRGLRLISVTGVDAVHTPPNCVWDHSAFNDLLDHWDDGGVDEQIRLFTEHHAEMCLASRYSEAIVCNIDSDEQQDALHCDYLDAERIRYYCLRNYFGRRGINSFYARARDLVSQHAQAITLLAERLLAGETLDYEQVLSLINEAN